MLVERRRSGIPGPCLEQMISYSSRASFAKLMATLLCTTFAVTLQWPRSQVGPSMVELEKPRFDVAAFLASAGLGRRIIQLAPKEAFFAQGDSADSVYYLQKGRARVTVVSPAGKEATIALLTAGDFVGEEALAAMPGLRLATATAITACTTLRISREEMIRVMHVEHTFSDLFLKVILERSMRIQADLVDQLFNSSEKRLARILVLMAEFGKPGEPEQYIPKISQETLAEMVGTTRSRVSFFMNRFRKLGFIEYNGRIKVRKSLLDVVLHEEFSERHPERVPASPTARSRSKSARRG
jgi:CRP/FNR family transcriptional regulator, cyclic AMP receptor protein